MRERKLAAQLIARLGEHPDRSFPDEMAWNTHLEKLGISAIKVTPDPVMIVFITLDRLLARLHAKKPELLMVLDRPEIPLHTNGSENDIRCHVTRRKVSGGTRSDLGRDCRDAVLGIAKTCAELEIAFWDYLGTRLAVPGSPHIPYLPALVLARSRSP